MQLDRLVACSLLSLLFVSAAPRVCRAHDVNPELPGASAAERTERYQPTPARGPRADGTGMPLVITGGVFGAAGAASIAFAPVCSMPAVSGDDGLCFGFTAASGGVSLGLGLVILAAGLIELDVLGRSDEATSQAALSIDFAPALSGGVFRVSGPF